MGILTLAARARDGGHRRVIIFCERAPARIPVQYAKRVVGRRMYGGQSSHLPLKLNTAGVIPPIFASSLLVFPATIAQFVDIRGRDGRRVADAPGRGSTTCCSSP
jgi:preprotein translocase subunit SecY